MGLINSVRGRMDMLKTIAIGTCVTVQGLLVKTLADGRVTVRVGEATFSGRPIQAG